MESEEIKDIIIDGIEEMLYSEDEFSLFKSLDEKMDKLISLSKIEERTYMATKILDKFEDYMKNIDKLNQMINEFKGLVAIVRGETAKFKKEI